MTRYKADDILKMSVDLIAKDLAADLDKDGKITSKDARIKSREEAGLASPVASLSSSDGASLLKEDIVDKILEKSSEYSYDVNADPLYKQYSELYKNEGLLGAKDIFGLSSSLTGGYGNSYGLSAASSLIDSANEKTLNKVSELEEKAYDRHKDEISNLYDILDMLYDAEDRALKKEESARDTKKDALSFALSAADSGDYYYLNKLGIDTSALENKALTDRAKLLAQYGDYSGLKELGVDLRKLKTDELTDRAELLAKYGDYSGLKEIGVDLSKLEKDELMDMAKLFAQYKDYSLLRLLKGKFA